MEVKYGTEWTNAAIIRLVREYQKRPELWDNRHEMYRMFTVKHEAWEEMANLFECEIVDIKKKMNSVLASHRRENAKVRAGGASNWYLFNYLKFLPSHIDDNDNHDTFEEVENDVEEYLIVERNDDDDQTDYEHPSEELHEKIIIKEEDHPKKVIHKPTARKHRSHKPRLVKSMRRKLLKQPSHAPASINTGVMDILKTIKKSELMKKKDECDSFGEYIATSLRKHNERTRSMIKHAINNILFEQEMKKYSGSGAGQYQVTVVEDDENPLILGDQIQED